MFDDDRGVVWNAEIRGPGAIRTPRLDELLGTGRPVTQLTLALDRRAGIDPRRFHATGLLLHLVAVVAVLVLLRRLLARVGHPRAAGVALAVAAVFALHPVQVESVAYVSQRAEVLATILYVGALLLLDAAVERWRTWRGLLAWAGSVGTWIVAMGAKAIAISLPGAFVLDQSILAPAGSRGGRPALRRALRALLLAVPFLGLALWSARIQFASFEAAPAGGAGFTSQALPWWQYLLTQLRVQWLYLRLLAWPSGLSIDRPFTASTGLDPAVVAAGAGVVALAALATWLWWRAERAGRDEPVLRLCSFGILLWFVVLAPTSSVVPVADLAVEHRLYLASLGPALAVVVAADALLHRWLAPRAARLAGIAAAILVAAVLAGTLRLRAETWSSAVGIWTEAAAMEGRGDRVLSNLGIARKMAGDTRGAEVSFRAALATVRSQAGMVLVGKNYGALLIDLGRPEEALALLDRAVAYAPDDPGLRANRATALGMLGRNDEALQDARRAVAADGTNPQFRSVLGVALLAHGDVEGALREFGAAERLDPGNPIYPVNAAIALTVVGRRSEACATYRRARATTRVLPLPRNAAAAAASLGCPLD